MMGKYKAGFIALIFSTTLNAQSNNQEIDSVRTGVTASPLSRISAEIKPLPTALSIVPGVGAVAFGVEGFVAENVAIYSDIVALDSALPQTLWGEDIKNRDNLFPRALTGGSVDLGARYYGASIGHTWYTGAKIGYAATDAEWEFRDEVMDQETATITPGVQAGYRWLW